MSSRGAQQAPFSEGGRTRGGTRVGTRRDLTLPQCPELLGIPTFKSCLALGWTCLLLSQKPENKDEEDRHFFSPAMKKNHTQRASCTFFPNCLKVWWERNGCRRHRACHQKRHIPKQNLNFKRHYKGSFICTKLIKWPTSPQSTENPWSQDVSKWLLYWTEKYWDPNLKSPLKLWNLGSKTTQVSKQW